MAQIKKIYAYYNRVLTNNGEDFYPVTTSKAVYEGSRTLYDLLHDPYIDNGTSSNGIYAWLEHLENMSGRMISRSEFSQRNAEMQQEINGLATLHDDFENYQSNINTLIARHNAEINEKLSKKLNKIEFDDLPTQASTNLVTSGGIYSFVLKQLKQLPTSNNTSSTSTSVGTDVNIDEVLCSGDYDSLETPSTKPTQPENPQVQEIDLSIYCTKAYAEQLFSQIEDKDTTYTAGNNIQISANNVISATDTKYTGDGVTIKIDGNNVISAMIDGADMTEYYSRTIIDNKLTEIRNLINEYEGDGETVFINNGIISAIIPDIKLPDMSLYYTAEIIDQMLIGIQPVRYVGDNKTISINDENVISAILPEAQLFDVSSDSDNVHVEAEVNGNVTTYKIKSMSNKKYMATKATSSTTMAQMLLHNRLWLTDLWRRQQKNSTSVKTAHRHLRMYSTRGRNSVI